MLILDTCALIFWTLDRARLSANAARAVADADRVAISSISVWELGIKMKHGKLFIPLSLQDYVERLNRLDRFDILPVDERIWMMNLELDWAHQDPADRTVVATAALHGCPLVTSNARIQAFYPSTLW